MTVLFKRIFTGIILSLLIVITALGIFISGASILMNMRDYDATIGLISRPKNAYNKIQQEYSKLFPEVKVEAWDTVNCIDCTKEASEATRWSLDTALNKLLRQIVMSFVKAFMSFLMEQFKTLMNKISEWTSTLFGVQLNLCNVTRYLALQAYSLYNKIEKSVGDFADKVISPIESKADKSIQTSQSLGVLKSTIADATASAESAKVMEQADKSYPECASRNQSNSPVSAVQKEEIKKSIAEIGKVACETWKIDNVVGKNAAGLVAGGFLKNQCFGVKEYLSNAELEIEDRMKDIASSATKAIDEQKRQTPDSCKGAILMQENITTDLQGEMSKSGSNIASLRSQLNSTYNQNRNSSTMTKAYSAYMEIIDSLSSSQKIRAADQNECAVSNKVEAAYQAIQAGKGEKAPETDEGSLLDAILADLKNFISSLIQALVDIINNIINNVIDKFMEQISKVGGGILTNAFSEFTSGLKTEVSSQISTLKTNLNNDVNRALSR